MRWMLFLVPVLVAGCDDSTTGPGDPADVDLTFDFATGAQGWAAGFADYPEGGEAAFDLEAGPRPLPAPLDTDRSAILLSGDNHSDDLLMYVVRAVEDLTPSARYAVRLTVTLATDAPTGCVGVGGSPGESVWVKAAAVGGEPARAVDESQHWRLAAGMGNQSDPGPDGQVLGTVATANTDCANRVYATKTLSSPASLVAETDAAGRLWLVVGIDSGFEAKTAAYLMRIDARLERVGG